MFCTTGVLLRRLQCDPDLAAVSHVFVDEVHERDLNTDFVLIILKDLLLRRRTLKLVLMSATLNADTFSEYFGGVPTVNIPGRAHPVTEYRLEDVLEFTEYTLPPNHDCVNKNPKEDLSVVKKRFPKSSDRVVKNLMMMDESVINYDLIALLLEFINDSQPDGAILVFLPGLMEITKCVEAIGNVKTLNDREKVKVYPLHSTLSTAEQVGERAKRASLETEECEAPCEIADTIHGRLHPLLN